MRGWTLAALLLVATAAAGTEAPAPLRFDGAPVQGALVRGWAPPGTSLALRGKNVRVDADGAFVLGFGRDEAGPVPLEITPPQGPARTERLAVARREWPIQRIDGLPPGQVTPDTAALERIRAEQTRLDAARAVDSPEQGFRGPFTWPASGPISGVYGSQRVLNGQPRAPHVGLDIAGPEGAPVRAPAAGVVRLAEPDLFFLGGTVILDHGHGVTTLYAHLSAVAARPGQRLGPGDALGRIGKTGRVTGAHLHFALYWQGIALDPAGLLPQTRPAAE
ncbi:MAG: M23 family metallopeptidase [Proteobacteria bacterium]|nr:M23 family metallopeptidase [Pseudomonadota bacterium]